MGIKGGGRPSADAQVGELGGVVHTLADVSLLLERITFTRGCPLPCYLEVRRALDLDDPRVRILATTRVRDTTGPKKTMVNASELIRLPDTKDHVFGRVVRLLDRMWAHELRETIQLDGVRVLDPHRGGER